MSSLNKYLLQKLQISEYSQMDNLAEFQDINDDDHEPSFFINSIDCNLAVWT